MSRHPLVPAELTHGPFTLVEAREAGLTRRQLQGASWRRMGSSLYVWAPLADDPGLFLAAVRRRLPVAAAFSGKAAAWLHGLDLPPCDPVEVTIPESWGISARAGMVVRRGELADQDVVERLGMRVTSAMHRTPDSVASVVQAALSTPDPGACIRRRITPSTTGEACRRRRTYVIRARG